MGRVRLAQQGHRDWTGTSVGVRAHDAVRGNQRRPSDRCPRPGDPGTSDANLGPRRLRHLRPRGQGRRAQRWRQHCPGLNGTPAASARIALIARGLVLAAATAAGVRGLFLATRAAHGTEQKLRLLVRRLGLEAFAAPTRLLLWRRRGLRRRLRALFGRRWLRTALEVRPFAALALALVMAVAIKVAIAIAVAEATMIAAEGAVVAVVVVAAVLARLRMPLGVRRRRLEGGLREATLVEQILTIILGKLVAGLGEGVRPAQALLAVAAVALGRSMHLLAVSHDDPAIVLRVLKVILGKHRVARGLGVARQRDVFLGDMGGRTANLHVRPVRLKAAR